MATKKKTAEPAAPVYEDRLLEPVDSSIKQVGLMCGRPSGCKPFVTVGWDTEEQARARMAEHHRDHEGELMTELVEFEAAHGFVRAASPPDVVDLPAGYTVKEA